MIGAIFEPSMEDTIVKKKPVVVAVVGVVVLTLIALAALAASPNPYTFSQNGRTVTANEAPGVVTPANHDTKLTTIAGNLSTYQYGVYFCCFGNTIAAGPPNFPFQTWVAIPFTPTADATVTRVEAAVGTFGGADAGAFQIQLLADDNDSPGKPIKTFTISSEPTYGTCCTLDVGKDKAGIRVTKDTQYWIAVTTSSKQTSFAGGWAFNSTDMRSHGIASWCEGSSEYCGSNSGVWVVGMSGDPLPAYAILGK
jgi:hypothetical protein